MDPTPHIYRNVLDTSQPPSYEHEIMRALGRLEAGQVHSREHVSQRVDDLRVEVTGRMDRMDKRVTALEDKRLPLPDGPWWRDMSPREWLVWALIIFTAIGWVKVDVLERLISTLAGAPK